MDSRPTHMVKRQLVWFPSSMNKRRLLNASANISLCLCYQQDLALFVIHNLTNERRKNTEARVVLIYLTIDSTYGRHSLVSLKYVGTRVNDFVCSFLAGMTSRWTTRSHRLLIEALSVFDKDFINIDLGIFTIAVIGFDYLGWFHRNDKKPSWSIKSA